MKQTMSSPEEPECRKPVPAAWADGSGQDDAAPQALDHTNVSHEVMLMLIFITTRNNAHAHFYNHTITLMFIFITTRGNAHAHLYNHTRNAHAHFYNHTR